MAAEFSSTDLVKALRKQVTVLEDDLRARVDGADVEARQPEVGERWRAEYTAALKAQRTAASWYAWRDERVTQAAVAWVLLTVFARYSEDHALVSKAWIGGPDADSRQQALDARRAYFTAHPEHTDREWLGEIIEHFTKLEATRGLVDAYSPLHQVTPSGDSARGLLEFWWERTDSSELRWSFGGMDTRFLGDVYEGLSVQAQKRYALRQTPEFVEEFILDQTLEPALAERPLEGFAIIDPTCGSGHFLLGAFRRLIERWQRAEPGLGSRVLVQRALSSVYGVDINPFAVAIARFRLIVAALEATGDKSIETLIDIKLNLAAGDSLLWGARQQILGEDILSIGEKEFAYSTENDKILASILQRQYDAVVGNPPYIKISDLTVKALYKKLYPSCYDQFTLAVPFMELFFLLAHPKNRNTPAGRVGKITSSAFMKRNFGRPLVESFLSKVDLRFVIDSEGAWIPGHNGAGTPTAILFGTGGARSSLSVHAVLSTGRRESKDVGERGLGPCWQSILAAVSESGFRNEWVESRDLERQTLDRHPWTLSGGGAIELLDRIQSAARTTVGDRVQSVGYMAMTRADDAYIASTGGWARRGVIRNNRRSIVAGASIRDYFAPTESEVLFPYDSGLSAECSPEIERALWPAMQHLIRRKEPNGSQLEIGKTWYEWSRFVKSRFRAESLICFAEIATHNHFMFGSANSIYNQTSPVIELKKSGIEKDSYDLLSILNSSTVCFWLKSKCKPKGGKAGISWARTYQFNSTSVESIPVPETRAGRLAMILKNYSDRASELLDSVSDGSTCPLVLNLEKLGRQYDSLISQMIAIQEEIDWTVYKDYGITEESITFEKLPPGISSGERSFEIKMIRDGFDESGAQWFESMGAALDSSILDRFDEGYRKIIERRIEVIGLNHEVGLLESPEFKRRWMVPCWNDVVESAFRKWVLNCVDNRDWWFDEDGRPLLRSLDQLADLLDKDPKVGTVLQKWAENPAISTAAALRILLASESVPYLAVHRYTAAGLEKRAEWELAWKLQWAADKRREVGVPIPVPQKYRPSDFLVDSYWKYRGEFDLQKEPLISYPSSGRDRDASTLLGWGGWDHAEQAFALAGLIDDRIDRDGWDQTNAEMLKPMLAGLLELTPWLRQWHCEIDAEYGESVADTVDAVLRERSQLLGVTFQELSGWRPNFNNRPTTVTNDELVREQVKA